MRWAETTAKATIAIVVIVSSRVSAGRLPVDLAVRSQTFGLMSAVDKLGIGNPAKAPL
jgi:hypothetical protein